MKVITPATIFFAVTLCLKSNSIFAEPADCGPDLANCIVTITVIGTREAPNTTFDWNYSQGRIVQYNQAYSSTFYIEQEKKLAADKAKGKLDCLTDMNNQFNNCSKANNNDLFHNQSVCNNMGVGAAALTTTAGVLAVFSGVGAPVGATMVAFSAAIGGYAYNQCNNMSTRIYSNGAAECANIKNQKQLACDAI